MRPSNDSIHAVRGGEHCALGLAAMTLLFVTLPSVAWADDGVNGADTAWILISTALVLFMTIPGLALFYGGLVATKNVLSVLMQCFSLTAAVSILWLVFGYSMAFDTTGMVAGGGRCARLRRRIRPDLHGRRRRLDGPGHDSRDPVLRVPDDLCDHHAGADRRRLRRAHALLGDDALLPDVARRRLHPDLPHDLGRRRRLLRRHGRARLRQRHRGAHHRRGGRARGLHRDRATYGLRIDADDSPQPHDDGHRHRHALGGLVRIQRRLGSRGQRKRRDGDHSHPHLGVGCGAHLDERRVDHPQAAEHARSRDRCDRGPRGGDSGLGLHRTDGWPLDWNSSGFICFLASTTVKRRFGYDDSLDVFGVHGVGGFVGTVLAGVFCAGVFGGNMGDISIGSQVGIQLYAAVVTVVYTVVATFVILKVVDKLVGLRVDSDAENKGLDIVLHEESGYRY